MLRPSRPAVGRGGQRDRRRAARASTLHTSELRAHCAAALARYKVPKRVRPLAAAAAAHALGQAAAPGALGDELRPQRLPPGQPRELGRGRLGLGRRQELMRSFAAPVSHWMIEAVSPQPGERVLELAAGMGETGMLAAELVAPVGGVIVSDQAEAMLAGARARAAELGLANLEFQVLNAEWIDLPLASFDVVLCRWGYMLMADPETALGETRRVLRPGGRLALAVWDALELNPWAALPARELRARGLAPEPDAAGALARAHSPSQAPPAWPSSGGRRLRGRARGGARADAPPPRLRGAVGQHARPLPRLPRRRALAARGPRWPRSRRRSPSAFAPTPSSAGALANTRPRARGARRRLSGPHPLRARRRPRAGRQVG